MNLNFKIEYHTRWGESLALVGADDKVWPMSYAADGIWTLSVPKAGAAFLDAGAEGFQVHFPEFPP